MPLIKDIGTQLLPPVLKLLYSTLRISIINRKEPLPDRSNGVVFAFWHGKMIVGWLLAQQLFPEIRPSAVVSLSQDGQILSKTLERLQFRLIRGSSSKGREQVKAGMLDALHNRGIIAITPDGPQGPLHRFKYGTIRLASEQRIPILFADMVFSRVKVLDSWDRFEIPLPFSKVAVTLHRIDVPAFSSEQQLRHYTAGLDEQFGNA